MEVAELLAYRKDFLEECKDDNGFISESSFLESCLPLMNDAKLVDSEDYTDCNYHYDAEKLKVNGYKINETGERLQLFIVDEDSVALSASDASLQISQKLHYDALFSKCTKFLNKSVKKNLFESIQDNHPVKVLISLISSAKGFQQIDVIEIFLVSATVTVETRGILPQPKRLDFDNEKMNVSFTLGSEKVNKEILILKRLVDLNFFHNITVSQGNRESLVIDFVKTFEQPIDCLKAADEALYTSYLCVMPARIISDLYKLYSTRLLEKNVRSFLQFKGVNKRIRLTILQEPEKFLAYNNGLTITASEAVFDGKNGNSKILSLKDFQIVNGGQTTASIYFCAKDRIPIDLVRVAAKINILKPASEEELDELITNISIFSNSQTKVTTVDLSSRNKHLLKIKTLSETIVTPLGTKWFFERARGEINTLIRKYNNRKTFLEREYPKKRRITKEQLAKYYVSWGEQPYLVKKGGEKVFRIFISSLEREYPSPDDLDLTFYEDMIGKAMIFKELEALYGSGKNSIGQIRSAVVPYTMSLVYRYCNEGNTITSSFKIVELWKNGGFDEALSAYLYELMELVNKLLLEHKLTDDVNESTKKPEQWNIIKDCQNIKEFFKDPDSKKVFSRYKFTTDQLGKRYPLQDHYMEKASAIPSNTWFALAKWAKDNNKFGTTERKFLYNIGKYINSPNGISPRQAKWAHDLYEQAKEDGFDEINSL